MAIIHRVSGPVVTAEGLDARMYDVVRVGKEKLVGEVIEINGDKAVIQVYEDTSGIAPGEPVETTGMPLMVELGPGILNNIYDGIQRPLPELQKLMGDFIKRGASVNSLDRKKKWKFIPSLKKGEEITEGEILGTVKETNTIEHRVLSPCSGKIDEIKEGSYTVEETIGKVGGKEITLMQRWPIRAARRVKEKLVPDTPLITGIRILDSLFPLAKGGTASIPGPFGAGKTVTQQSLAKWSDADIIVYVGCGERGNEMTEVLVEFPELIDPKSGNPLMERTTLIANTSNMPVAAREASIYTGITIAEYYRDMGYDVALMADSTSRWAEAMREISSRMEEMPGEEGYPAYLSARLSEFYERAGKAILLSGSMGSISIIGAVSPPGGDFSEPVTQSTQRITKAFWALDAALANRRHFPSINWMNSYSQYESSLAPWYNENITPQWTTIISKVKKILSEEQRLQEIVQLIGSDALPEKEQLTLEVARLIREFFLQQNAFHDVDSYCAPAKSARILQSILYFEEKARAAIEAGVSAREAVAIKSKNKIGDAKFYKDYEKILNEADAGMENEINEMVRKNAA
ncbi:MAG: V-type ATP synthase subunit A [Candidatus Aenigmarchaeota archaeon]|nr:V-type ATP synthase subunit A [Candidatus Aenigmarchaeota archaeon]